MRGIPLARAVLAACGGGDPAAASPSIRESTEALKDGAPLVRSLAAQTLGAIGPDAAAAERSLKEATQDSDASVQNSARAALQRIQGEKP